MKAAEAVVKMASKIIVGGVVATEVVAEAPVVDSKWVRSERRLTWPFRIS